MIEGLKVTVSGAELQKICRDRADHHFKRRATYEEQLAAMEAAKVEAMAYTNGDPIKTVRERLESHDADGRELQWIAEHVRAGEDYLLARDDLARLGIVRNRF